MAQAKLFIYKLFLEIATFDVQILPTSESLLQ